MILSIESLNTLNTILHLKLYFGVFGIEGQRYLVDSVGCQAKMRPPQHQFVPLVL